LGLLLSEESYERMRRNVRRLLDAVDLKLEKLEEK
jgi:hypothetical protein